MNTTGQSHSARRLAAAFFALLWLVSCEPSVRTPAPVNPTGTSLPSATLTPQMQGGAGIPQEQGGKGTPKPNGSPTPTVPLGPLAIISPVPDKIGLYELLELEIHSDFVPANPFDPDELDIRMEFTSPSGKIADIGAFWYQDYYKVGGQKGQPGWRARFTPTETGEWSAIARIPQRGLESDPIRFTVVDSGRLGFVRVNPNNPRYFALDDGSFFFPIGLNIAWWSGAGKPLSDYQKWMDPFAANGGNAIRVWMAEWSFGLEWSNTPLGDYTNRLYKAWLLDQIFSMADERDMYILLVLLNCADFNTWQTDGWTHTPYNAANGGPLERADQFVTDPTARALLQRRLNYIINRWGYSPRLLAWEWWNEVNLAPFTDTTLIPWLQEMTAYVREHDVNGHLVTNSYAIRDLSPIWSMPEMDIIQKHEYAHQVDSPVKDMAERAAADFARLAGSAPPKPILLGEFGYGDEGYGKEIDKSGIHLHNGIWATTFAGYAGSGMYWWWDVYVEVYNSWHHFNGLKVFLEGVDLSGYQPFSPLIIRGQGGTQAQAAGLGLRGDDVLIWLRSDEYTVQAVEAAAKKAGVSGAYNYRQPALNGLTITLPEMVDGAYTVRWYDPQGARWLDAAEAAAQGGRLVIAVPDFNRDLAARIEKIE